MNALAHILLVEDNPDDFEATSRGLKKNHFLNPVSWCRNGKDALDYLHRKGVYAKAQNVFRPDLILLDLNMPGIDGRKVLEIIKSDDELKSIPVVILTTSRASQDVEQCYAIGANTYIQKPVSFEGLTQAIAAMKDYWFGIAILPFQPE